MNDFDRKKHGQVINEFLNELNCIEKDNFILKGGTALLICYGLDRFSEDIDLDGTKRNIKEFVNKFCMKHSYSYRLAKDTDTVKRAFINYGGEKLLKVEVSYRKRIIPKEQYTNINGIYVYSIDMLCMMKNNAYMSRDKIRDLYDLCFIGNRYYNQLSSSTKIGLQNALEYKGLEQFDYIIQTQTDPLINNNKLAEAFLKLYDKVGLLYDEKEKEQTLSLKSLHQSDIEYKKVNYKGKFSKIEPKKSSKDRDRGR